MSVWEGGLCGCVGVCVGGMIMLESVYAGATRVYQCVSENVCAYIYIYI